MEPAIFNGQQGYNIVIASVQLDNEQRYRKQVQNKIRNGMIGPAGHAVLAQWQQRLSLSTEQAKAIENEILQPYRERQKHLALYTKALEAEKTFSYPLHDVAIQDLKDLQRLLSLRDEDVRNIEKLVLGNRPKEPQSTNQSTNQTLDSAHSVASESISISPESISPEPISLENVPANAKRWVRPAKVNLRLAQPSLQPLSYKSVPFETVRVNAYGQVVEQIHGEATTFCEALDPRTQMTMVHIPGGEFVMGAAKGEKEASDDEFPSREVSLSGFWIGQCTVTQAQWKAIMGPKAIAGKATPAPASQIKKPLQPIENIFWTHAAEFCHKLSAQTGRDYRLPSNAQWEYACRAGTTTPIHFGETLTPDLANYNGNYTYSAGPKGLYRQQTTEVGSFSPNAFGLYDMHGNVWEWCLDGWQAFEARNSSKRNIQRLSGQKKSLRGGSWFYLPSNCRSAYRLTYPFHNRTDDIGFRVVCLSPLV